MKRIILTGGYGHGNFGDDYLAVQAAALASQFCSEVIVSAGDGFESRGASQSRLSLLRDIRKDDLVLLAGGGLFNDAWNTHYYKYFTSLALIARSKGARIAAVGFGIEPVRTRVGLRSLQLFSKLASAVGVRDVVSADTFSIHTGRSAFVGPDLAWNAESSTLPPRPSAEPPLIGVTFAAEDSAEAENRLKILRELLQRLAATVPSAQFLLVPMSRANDALHDDRPWLERLRIELGPEVDVRLTSPNSWQDAVILLRRVTYSVGFRLHGLLIPYTFGSPVVGISRSEKVRATFADLPNSFVVSEFDFSVDRAATAWSGFNGSGATNSHVAHLAAQRSRVLKSFEYILEQSCR